MGTTSVHMYVCITLSTYGLDNPELSVIARPNAKINTKYFSGYYRSTENNERKINN